MDRIWWKQITSTSCFIDDIVQKINANESIVIGLSELVPWYDTMSNIISEEVGMQNSNKSFHHMDDDSSESPGELIFKFFCKAEKRAEYRPAIGYATFLATSNDIVLNNRFVWIHNIAPERLDLWIEFAADYKKAISGTNQIPGTFILETRNSRRNGNKKIAFISYADKISELDSYIFCMQMLAQRNLQPNMQCYLSELISSLASMDIELCAKLGRDIHKTMESPCTTLSYIVENEYHSDGSAFMTVLNKSDIDTLVWKAQIKFVFPLIEEYRASFINNHQTDIMEQLPMTTSFGQTYNEPNDVEIGTLAHLAKEKKLKISYKEFETLEFYKNIRNYLAHLKSVSFDDIKKLFVLKQEHN